MPTAAEVRKWTRPLLDGDSKLELIGRNLIIRPVHHLLRGIYVDRTSNAHWSNVRYYLVPLFNAPSPSHGFTWGEQIVLGRNDGVSFQDEFMSECRSAIDDVLLSVETVADLLEQTSRDDLPVRRRFGPLPIDRYYRDYGVALAALGRLEEARTVLAKIDEDERNFCVMLERGRAALAKRANSGVGKFNVHHASFHLAIIAELKRLLGLLEAEDRGGIGELLREWEKYTVKLWKVEHLWEPTPFPVELAAGQ